MMRYGPGPGHWWDEFSENPTAPDQKPKHRWLFLMIYIMVILGTAIALYMIFAPTMELSTPIIGN